MSKTKSRQTRNWLDGFAVPARRHKCEICSHIFKCHLCTLSVEHELHKPSRTWLLSVYVCLDCIIGNDLLIVETHSDGTSGTSGTSGRRYTYYCHLTGEIIQ